LPGPDLACRHHKPVDDQVEHYTTGVLHKIKTDHEAWWECIEVSEAAPIRPVPDPLYPIPRMLTLVITGNALWDLASGTSSREATWDANATDEQRDVIATFMEALGDWLDVEALNGGFQVGRDAAKHLNGLVEDLTKVGLLIGVRKRHCLLTGGVGVPSQWAVLDIEFQPLADAQLVDKDGRPL
jgi:hypothetical protein